MKKLFILSILAIVVAGGIFAQEEKAANARSNWVSGELGLWIESGLRYERMLNQHFSFGAIYFYGLISGNNVNAFARFYPWGKTFFAGAALGYHAGPLMGDDITGIGVTPEFGWKIDVGDVGKFFIQPGVRVPIAFGMKKDSNTGESTFGVGSTAVIYFGMGGSF